MSSNRYKHYYISKINSSNWKDISVPQLNLQVATVSDFFNEKLTQGFIQESIQNKIKVWAAKCINVKNVSRGKLCILTCH